MKDPLKILGICGSLRQGSHTRQALKIALRGAGGPGMTTELLDLHQLCLDFCDGRDDAKTYHPDVLELKHHVQSASGILLGSPEYHGSFSGVLKNAMDLMGFEEFEGKMIGLIGVSGGSMGALNALNHLRVVGRQLHAWVLPEQVSIPNAWKAFDEGGAVKDPQLEKRLLKVGRQVALYASLHNSDHAMEFIKQWECAEENPGG